MSFSVQRTDIPSSQATAYYFFVDGLRMLASSYSSLKAELPEFVVIPDEVALSFDDSLLYSRQLLEEKLISESVFSFMKEIDLILDKIQETDLFDIPDFENHLLWENCRTLAKKVLKELGEDIPT